MDNNSKELDPTLALSANPPPGFAPPVRPAPVQFDFSKTQITPINFCHLRHTNEEFIIDMGIAGQDPNVNMRTITNSVMLSPYAAKRLARGLGQLIADWEHKFGPIETEFADRLVPQEPTPLGVGSPTIPESLG